MEIAQVRFEDAQALTAAMVDELSERYGGEGASPADGSDFLPPYGIFLVAQVDGAAFGCGGLRLIADGVGEIKRMYVAPDARGRGIARELLRALVAYAREQGLEEVWLETGTKQPEAMALYASEGFLPIAGYGYYKDEPLSRCFGLILT